MQESPFVIHRDIFLNGKYGTAYLLQQFALHLRNPCQYPFVIDHYKGGFDTRHLHIYQEMKDWFWEHGEASEGFREVVDIIEVRGTEGAKKILAELTRLQAMRPEDYHHHPDSDQLTSYQADLANHQWWHQRNVAKGYIEG